jgi:hypothetical protein
LTFKLPLSNVASIQPGGLMSEEPRNARTAYQILTEAQDLIRDQTCWTRGAYARDAQGENVGAMNPRAVCWCFTGAIIKCGGGEPFGGGLGVTLLDLFVGESAGPIHTNDDKGHDAVMALFDRLREKAKALNPAAV